MKTPLFAFLFFGLFGGTVASCSDDSDRVCIPNTTRVCAGLGRCEGVEVCAPDGMGYGECNCSGPPRGEGGTSSEPEVVTSLVGRACTNDAACGVGLTCFTSASNEFFGGGPGNGYCTLTCSTDAECSSIDRRSECVVPNAGAAGLCMRTCLSQTPNNPLAENKCLGRRDVACQSVAYLRLAMFTGSRQDGWCYPQCGSDEDCPGRRCDLARGLCVDTPTPGLPIGAKCTADAQCSGRLCIGLGNTGESFCSAPCVFGERLGCGDGLSGVRTAGCLAAQIRGFTGAEGIGDVGYCGELCAQTSDCEQAPTGWQCALTPDAVTRFSAPGLCDAPELQDGGIDGGGLDASPGDAG